MPGFTIRQKLTSIGLLSSLAALVTASIAFLAYDVHTFRQTLVQRVLTEVAIVGFNSVSPLLFDDRETATSTLAGLAAEPAVSAAILFREGESQPFATFVRGGGRAPELQPLAAGERYQFRSGELHVREPVQFDGRVVGRLQIRADLSELAARRRVHLGIAAVILGGSLLLAIVIARLVEETISRPILHLAETARTVSVQRDFAVRAPAGGQDEIGDLIATFNEMLDQIQRQNTDLEDARRTLELRVEARTRELAAANRELEAFSYSVSHDLRAPLRAIDGFSKALLAGHGERLDEQGRHYLDRVRAGTRRMAELIDDLLGLARVSRHTLVRQEVDVTALACRVAGDLARSEPERRVEVAVQPGLVARADRQLVAVVMENLLGNAWKFTAKRTDARIEVRRSDDGPPASFQVSDNGAGFDMTYADKLFGAFQRLHSDADFEGTGIGLATVQRIVHLHGGRISAQAATGQGATFTFTLESET